MSLSALRRPLVCLLVTLSLLLLPAARARAYTPDSPEVKQMIDRAVAYLKENHQTEGASFYPQLGGMCLVGMAIYKHTQNANDELVQAAVAKCKDVVKQGVPWGSESNYSVGIAVLFLCELDPQGYRVEIQALLNALHKRQQPGGGWSYESGPHSKTGDTSQTQYGALAYWMAKRSGFEIPQERIERLCNWLMRTQDPAGNWGYQGKDPGSFQLVKQSEHTYALAAAGLGSVYICAELLGFVQEPDQEQIDGTPAALRLAGADTKKKGPITDRVQPAILSRCVNLGNAWFAKNFTVRPPQYQHYYLYGLERYMSFRELAEHTKNKEPGWYNQGVDALRSSQAGNGSWKSCEAGPVIDTSFAILFLLRSTQKSIRRIVEESGGLRAGKGLPTDLTKIAVDNKGNVVDTKATPPIEILLRELEEGDLAEIDTSLPEQLTLSKDPQKRAAELARLRRLVMNGPYQTRLTAVKTLGRDRDLDNVPVLIFALSDPDYRIVREARDGLRFISRKLDGFNLQIGDERPTKPVWSAAQEQWGEWYLSLRPDGALIE